jgi:short-chain Z-isoprenyl diphosphate synthase
MENCCVEASAREPVPATLLLRLLARKLRAAIERPFYALYERSLRAESRAWTLPRHIGVILDGNRRWARAAGLGDVAAGHARGADNLDEFLHWCLELGIPAVTIWVFSTENFNRDKTEVDALFQLFENHTLRLLDDPTVEEQQIRLRYIGRIERLPASLQAAIAKAEERTRDHHRFHLNVAVAYGGREEVLDGFRKCLRDKCRDGKPLDEVLDELTPEHLQPYLYAPDLPDPDLIIRTSGEVRLSGFLLWQSAYSEYYFCDAYWPEFRRIDFLRALRSYHTRQRRYGR